MMEILAHSFSTTLPFLGLALLIYAWRFQHLNALLAALWISLISFILIYQISGGEILGSFFGYQNASLYTLNLLILIIALLLLFIKLPFLQQHWIRPITYVFSGLILLGTALLLSNVWINAYFIETRRAGTPLLQIANFKPLPYCSHATIFYKVGVNGKLAYLCPHYYWVLPALGQLEVSPSFVLNHFAGHSLSPNEAIQNK